MSVKSMSESIDGAGSADDPTAFDSIRKDVVRGLKDGFPVLLGVILLRWFWGLRPAIKDSVV